MDSKKFVMSYSGGKDCMLAMYRKIKEGWTPVALITTFSRFLDTFNKQKIIRKS